MGQQIVGGYTHSPPNVLHEVSHCVLVAASDDCTVLPCEGPSPSAVLRTRCVICTLSNLTREGHSYVLPQYHVTGQYTQATTGRVDTEYLQSTDGRMTPAGHVHSTNARVRTFPGGTRTPNLQETKAISIDPKCICWRQRLLDYPDIPTRCLTLQRDALPGLRFPDLEHDLDTHEEGRTGRDEEEHSCSAVSIKPDPSAHTWFSRAGRG